MNARLLLTDVLDPAVPAVIAALQAEAVASGRPPWTVLGLVEGPATGQPRTSALARVPPAGVRELVVGPGMDEPGWPSWVMSQAVTRRVDAVLPWTRRAAVLLATQATVLQELGGALVCPPPPLVALTEDRWATAERLRVSGIPAAPARRALEVAELAAAARELGYPDRPLTVSPRLVRSGGGVWSVREAAGLATTSPNPTLPLYAVMAAASNGPHPVDLVVQLDPPGPDVEIDVLAADGTVLAALARTADRTGGGSSDATIGPVPARLAELVDQVVAELAWSQLLTIRIAWDRARDHAVVRDLRPGSPATAGLAAHAGSPLLAAAVDLAVSGRPPAPIVPALTGIRRFWEVRTWPA